MRFRWLTYRPTADTWLGIAGFAFGAWLIGFRNLNPISIEWLRSDAKLAQIGHEFFWRSPWLQFPFNATPTYGVGWRTGLNQSSQNSLLPLFFKPFSGFSDSGFQIQGLWLASCFSAQAVIARRIFLQLNLTLLAQVSGALIVLLSPSLFSRIGTLWHPQLAAHWLILLAVLFYLKKVSLGPWSALVFVSFSVHAYLSVIVFAVAVAAVFNQSVTASVGINVSKRIRTLFIGLLTMIATVIFAIYLLGFGNLVGNPTTVGVGRYRLNLLSFINPGVENYGYLTNSTSFFRNRQWLSEENEGFAYLGLGVILSVIVLIALLLGRRLRLRNSHVPLLVVSVLLFLVALSDHVAIGSRDVALPIPSVLVELRQTFRAATRFSWLAYHLLVISGWYAVSVSMSHATRLRRGVPLMLAVVLLQTVDVIPGVYKLHTAIRDNRADFAPRLEPEWSALFESYNRVALVPSVDANEDDVDLTDEERVWFDDDSLVQLAWLAALHEVELNYSFCSRSCLQSARKSTEQVRAELNRSGPADGTIYVFVSNEEWRRVAGANDGKAQLVGGLQVILGTPIERDLAG